MEDIGIDGVVVICSPGKFNGLEFRVQIKSNQKWTIKDNSIVVRNVKPASLRYWITGFTPTLIVLYETTTDRGFCAWANQVLADKTKLLSSEENEISLHIPMISPIDGNIWERIGHEVAGLSAVVGRRISMAGSVAPYLRALHVLSGAAKALYFVQQAHPKPGFRTEEQEALMLELEIVSHRDVIREMRALADDADSCGGDVIGFREYADNYKELCSTAIKDFDSIIQNPDVIRDCNVSPEGIAQHRNGFMHSLIDAIHQLAEAAAGVRPREDDVQEKGPTEAGPNSEAPS